MNLKKIASVIVFLLLLAISVFAAWWYYYKYIKAPSATNDNQPSADDTTGDGTGNDTPPPTTNEPDPDIGLTAYAIGMQSLFALDMSTVVRTLQPNESIGVITGTTGNYFVIGNQYTVARLNVIVR